MAAGKRHHVLAVAQGLFHGREFYAASADELLRKTAAVGIVATGNESKAY
jgi:hypothetical protein